MVLQPSVKSNTLKVIKYAAPKSAGQKKTADPLKAAAEYEKMLAVRTLENRFVTNHLLFVVHYCQNT